MIRNTSNPPRVVYCGPLFSSGTCVSRLEGLREIESDVEEFDVTDYFANPGWLERFDWKLTFLSPCIVRANSDFLAFCADKKPDIVWMDKGWWVWESTLRSLRRRGIFLVQHNTDALWPNNGLLRAHYRLIRKTLPLYHVNFTSNLNDLPVLNKRKDLCAYLTHLGYSRRRFNSAPLSAELARDWGCDLLFVGHYEPRTERYVSALADAKLNVVVFGAGWEKARNRKRLQDCVRYKMLNARDYEIALKAAKIGLCFVSEWNGNQTSGRSFEIPASGTFMLAQRTQQHLECFAEGVEAEFFGNETELVEKAKNYLHNDAQRVEIAARGAARCSSSDYSWARYMRDDWAKTLIHFNAFKALSSPKPV